MGTNNKINGNADWKGLDEKIEAGLKKTAEKLISEEKKKNGYLVISGKDGVVKKIPAKDL
jgi:hypothetical protein